MKSFKQHVQDRRKFIELKRAILTESIICSGRKVHTHIYTLQTHLSQGGDRELSIPRWGHSCDHQVHRHQGSPAALQGLTSYIIFCVTCMSYLGFSSLVSSKYGFRRLQLHVLMNQFTPRGGNKSG